MSPSDLTPENVHPPEMSITFFSFLQPLKEINPKEISTNVNNKQFDHLDFTPIIHPSIHFCNKPIHKLQVAFDIMHVFQCELFTYFFCAYTASLSSVIIKTEIVFRIQYFCAIQRICEGFCKSVIKYHINHYKSNTYVFFTSIVSRETPLYF